MPLTTIVIEDSETIRENLVSAMAELAGVQVVATAETVAEGIAALHEHKDHWQLAVIDLFLGGGTGLSVLRAYRDRLPHQRMVVLTNYATPEVRRRCLELGADGVFDKSTELEAFFELCNSYRV